MSKAMVVSAQTKFSTMQTFLQQKQKTLAGVLPKHFTAERMVRLALGMASKTPKLLDCTPASMLLALMDCAYYGLEPNAALGHAYILPYDNKKKGITEAQFMVGYKGLILLAHRGGYVKDIDAEVIYSNDVFKETRHQQPPFVHEPVTLGKPRGEVIGVYAAAYMANGHVKFKALSVEEVETYRARARAKDSGPWKTDWNAMAKKTAIRRLIATLPIEPDSRLANVVDQESRVEEADGAVYVSQPEDDAPEQLEAPKESAGDALAEKLGAEPVEVQS